MKSAIEIVTVRALSDNYCYLIRNEHLGSDAPAIAIDPSEATPILEALKERGWRLGAILNTHHHHDHVGGNAELKKAFNCEVICSHVDLDRVPGATRGVMDHEAFQLAGIDFITLSIPGHTRGQIAFQVHAADAVFVGDTMFSMGCGRLFEGTPADMMASLKRLMELPPRTRIYFGHEYTEKNASFALSVEPENQGILERLEATRKAIAARKVADAPTIASEIKVNPFLREGSADLRRHLQMPTASDLEVFTELRMRRNSF